MRFLPIAVALVPAFLSIGCTGTKTSRVQTGLFENDPEQTQTAYERIAEIDSGAKPVTRAELKEIGFDLEAPNIERLSGASAIKRVFGKSVLLKPESGVESRKTNVDLSDYKAYLVPYRHIVTTSDRFYISTKEVIRKGNNIRILFLFKKDDLCYHEMYSLKLDTYYSRYGFGEGILSVLRSIGRGAISIYTTVEFFDNPFAPIPWMLDP